MGSAVNRVPRTTKHIPLHAAVSLAALIAGFGYTALGNVESVHAQTASPPATAPASAAPDSNTPATAAPAQPNQLPQIVVSSPKKKQQRTRTARAGGQRNATLQQVAQTPPPAGPFRSDSASAHVTPDAVPSLGKTGTKLEDLPTNVQIIPRELLNQQGDIMLRQAISNASGVNQGGQDSLGYFDHFLIRGFNAQIYQDGFSDGDQLGGLSHSLNGVKSVEVLEGPGSALFGSGPPGGTINIVHYTPSSTFYYGDSTTAGSFGTVTNQGYVTGPTTVEGLNYRVDGTVSRSDGFRSLNSHDYEIRPDLQWNVNNHVVEFTLDARQTHNTPDSYGLLYFHGTPIGSVPIDAKYSTPWAFADETYVRPTITDKWWVNDVLTINNRLAYTYRTLDVERNGDSTSTSISAAGVVTGRQLRAQSDLDNSVDYQFEPVWTFHTGSVGHTLLTGFEAVHQTTDTIRQTADLPTLNAFAPSPSETPGSVKFLCDAKHSCDNDHLVATYLSAYATDQIDVTDRFKVRAGIRQEWWDTSLLPLVTVPTSVTSVPPNLAPGAFNNNGQPIIAGREENAREQPLSWNIAALYKLTPWVSAYGGISKSWLSNFNSENAQQGIGPAESALQYEGGLKYSFLNNRIILNTAVFRVLRNNVATPFTNAAGNEAVAFDAYKVDGVEASLDAKVTDQWHVLANATVMDPIVTASPQTAVQATVLDHAPQGVPRYLANLWTTYDFSIAGIHGFQVGAGLNYQDKTYSDNTNVNSIPAYTILNAEIAYLSPTWDVILNVKNLTNERYFIAANAAGAYVGDPLSAYLTVRYKN
jgi:iron complex outermembrane recepter protein